MEWITKNIKWIAIVLFTLLVFKNIQSCNRKNAIIAKERSHTAMVDSLKTMHRATLDSLSSEILSRDMTIIELSNELRVAGVKTEEAQKRAEAIQRAAENLRSNTTIEIKRDSQ